MTSYVFNRVQSVLVKYPYIVNLRDFIRDYYGGFIPLDSLLDINDYLIHTKRRIEAYLKNLNYEPSSRDDIEVISFYLSLMVTKIADPWSFRKFIDAEAKRCRKYLLSENDSVVEKIARKLGIMIEYLGSEGNKCGKAVVLGTDLRNGRPIIECYQYRMTIPQYIKLTEKLVSDPKWRLVNRYVCDGYVYLVKSDVTRIVEEGVKNYLSNLINDEEVKNILNNQKVKELVRYVLSIVKDVRGFTSREVRERNESLRGIIREEFFPPCIRRLKEALMRGEHLSHHQRFALATFLLNIGAGADYILNLFKNSPDFNEKIARYQIEHLAGLRGSRKKYKVYSCEKMRSLGICVSECGTRSPITYYWRELRDYMRNVKGVEKR